MAQPPLALGPSPAPLPLLPPQQQGDYPQIVRPGQPGIRRPLAAAVPLRGALQRLEALQTANRRDTVEHGSGALAQRAAGLGDSPGLNPEVDLLRKQLKQEERRVYEMQARETELAMEYEKFESEVRHGVKRFQRGGEDFLQCEQSPYQMKLRAPEAKALQHHENTLQQLESEPTQQAQLHNQQLLQLQATEAAQQQQVLDQ